MEVDDLKIFFLYTKVGLIVLSAVGLRRSVIGSLQFFNRLFRLFCAHSLTPASVVLGSSSFTEIWMPKLIQVE